MQLSAEAEAEGSTTGGDSGLTEEEVKILLQGAAMGDAESQVLIGRMALEGNIAEPDPEQAAEWFLKAAEQGDKDGQFNLGMLLISGNGVPQDMQEGSMWLEKAAEQGVH